MNKIETTVAMLVLTSALNGCAQLKIDVSLYDGPQPVRIDEASKLISDIEQDPSGLFAGSFDDVVKEVTKEYRDPVISMNKKARINHCTKVLTNNYENVKPNGLLMSEICDKIPRKTPVPPKKESITAELKVEIDQAAQAWAEKEWKPLDNALQREYKQYLSSYQEEVMTALSSLQKAIDANAAKNQFLVGKQAYKYHELFIAKARFDSNYAQVSEKFCDFFKDTCLLASSKRKMGLKVTFTKLAPDRTEGVSSDDAVVGRVVGSPIFNKYIAAITKDEGNWHLFNTNQFYASGGDAQFVAVRKGLVEFRQKSLDFDPSSTIAAGSALTQAGLKIAAAAATGTIPASSNTAKEGENAQKEVYGNSVKVVDEAKMTNYKDLLARREFAKKEYLFNLAEVLEKLNSRRAPTAEEIKKQLKSITTLFEARLELP